MICVEYRYMQTEMKISGHAEYAPEGQDIVCAGVSALFGALAIHPLTELIEDEHWRVVRPQEGLDAALQVLFLGILDAIKDISEQYPEHVQVYASM